jgi:hypothetical protein
MGMNIKNPEAHALAREIAARTWLSLTDAVLAALREKRAALAGEGERAQADRLLAYGRRLTDARARASADTASRPTSTRATSTTPAACRNDRRSASYRRARGISSAQGRVGGRLRS